MNRSLFKGLALGFDFKTTWARRLLSSQNQKGGMKNRELERRVSKEVWLGG
jgi:hypothetical protein